MEGEPTPAEEKSKADASKQVKRLPYFKRAAHGHKYMETQADSRQVVTGTGSGLGSAIVTAKDFTVSVYVEYSTGGGQAVLIDQC